MAINKDDVEFNEDIFDSMVYGTYDPTEDATGTNDIEDDDHEDTDQEADDEEEEELDGDRDGDADEDSEYSDEDEEEDAPVDTSDSDDEGDDTDTEDDAEDEAADAKEEDTTEESEGSTETDEKSDGDTQDTDTIDYKAFYDSVVNTEFVVNGKKVKGFADPQKIIQSQQMAGGFSEKMAGFKKYRPFMSPLQERGMLDDPAKFDLAMNLLDGDKEAIKAHLRALSIDPLDLDMEAISYTPTRTVATTESLVIEDAMERAKSAGIEDRVRKVVGSEWDTESFREFVSNEHVRNDLLNHIETGAYEVVTEKMGELSRLDYNGTYNSMSTVNKYRAAVQAIQAEEASKSAQRQVTPKAAVEKVTPVTTVKAEKDKITQARTEEKYKAEAAKREAEIAQQRKKASSMSKKKGKVKPKATIDIMDLEGADLDNLMEELISGSRR